MYLAFALNLSYMYMYIMYIYYLDLILTLYPKLYNLYDYYYNVTFIRNFTFTHRKPLHNFHQIENKNELNMKNILQIGENSVQNSKDFKLQWQ